MDPLNAIFTVFLKRYLCIPRSTANSRIYHLTATAPLWNTLSSTHQAAFNNLTFPACLNGLKLSPPVENELLPPVLPEYTSLCPVPLPDSTTLPFLKTPRRAVIYVTFDLLHSRICSTTNCFRSSEEADPPCLCKFCGNPLDKYHSFHCPDMSPYSPCRLMAFLDELV